MKIGSAHGQGKVKKIEKLARAAGGSDEVGLISPVKELTLFQSAAISFKAAGGCGQFCALNSSVCQIKRY